MASKKFSFAQQKYQMNLQQPAIKAALLGGKEILNVYESNFAVEHKDDKSPLTLADKNAHLAIVEGLKETSLPILSEEGRSIDFEERSKWELFWMVDPLDGTKEFVKRNGEFTVNIALIENGKSIFGVIYVPVKRTLYVGDTATGAYKVENIDSDNFSNELEKLSIPQKYERSFTMVGSRSHMSDETTAYMSELKDEHGDVEIMAVGSSLKLCMVAEGKADVYPRYAPTMEWDTAAGQAICEAAGFRVLQYNTDGPVVYNKENLLNPWFLVCK